MGEVPRVANSNTTRRVDAAVRAVLPRSVKVRVRKRDSIEAAERALGGDLRAARIEAPGHTVLEVEFKEAPSAYAKSHYPGASLTGPHTVQVEADDYYEILRALMFLV